MAKMADDDPNVDPEVNVDDPKGDPKGDKGDKGKASKIKIGDDEVDLSEVTSAVSLYKALQDPETGSEIIETLARRAGLLDRKGDLKSSDAAAEKKIDSISKKFLKEALGKDYDTFSDKVGPVFDKIIQHFMAEHSGKASQETAQSAWEKSVDDFIGEYHVTPKIERVMQELIADAPPNIGRKGFNHSRYLTRIYKAAVEELGETPTPPRSKQNSRKDDSIADFVVRDAPKELTLDDAIEAAMKGIRFRR
jgi:hypothetical protein